MLQQSDDLEVRLHVQGHSVQCHSGMYTPGTVEGGSGCIHITKVDPNGETKNMSNEVHVYISGFIVLQFLLCTHNLAFCHCFSGFKIVHESDEENKMTFHFHKSKLQGGTSVTVSNLAQIHKCI